MADIQGFKTAAIQAGYNPKDIDAIIDQYSQRQLAREGVTDVADLAKTDPTGALQLTQEGITKKREEVKPETEQTVSTLENLFFGEGDQESLAFANEGLGGRIPGVVESAKRAIAPGPPGSATERLNTYIRTLKSMRPQLAKAAGDSGNIAFAEQLQAGEGLPQATDTPTEAIDIMQATRQKFRLPPSKELEQLKQQIISEEETSAKKQGKPLSEKVVNLGESALQGLRRFFTGTENVIRDVVQTPLAGARTAAANELLATGEQLMNQAGREQDPQRKQQMIADAQEIFARVSSEAEGAASEFSKDVERNPLSRGAQVGLELGSAYDIAGGAKGIKTILRGGAKVGGKVLSPVTRFFKPRLGKEVLGEGLKKSASGTGTRDAIIKTAQETGKKVNANPIFSNINKWAKEAKATATSSEAKQIDDLLARAKKFYKGKNLNPITAKARWDTARQGFTSAGKTGDTVKAGYHRAIREALRKELDKVAPGFEKSTKLIREGIEQEKLLKTVRTALEREGIKKGLKSPIIEGLKKTGKGALQGTGAALALYAVSKALGLNFPGAAYSPE